MLPRRDLGRGSRPTRKTSVLDGLASLTRAGAQLQNLPVCYYGQREHIIQFFEAVVCLELSR